MISKPEVRDARWSSKASLRLPAWNKESEWKNGYRNLWLGVDNQASQTKLEFEVDNWSQFEEVLRGIELSLEQRFLLYIPAVAQGKFQALWSEVLDFFELRVPSWNEQFEPCSLRNGFPPHLALCLDKKATKNENQTTILVPHWESVGFVELLLYSVNLAFQEESAPHVLVIDDGSSDATFAEIRKICFEYGASIEQLQRVDKAKVADVGAVLDYGLKYVKTKYVCMLDADIVITNPEFEFICRSLIEDCSVLSIGLDTNLASSYHSNSKWGEAKLVKPPGRQLPGFYSVTNNLFRFMRTKDALAVSTTCGFARANDKRKLRDQLGRVVRKLSRLTLDESQNARINDLIKKRFFNSRFPIMPPTCDNGVAANAWMDENMMGIKWNLPITSYGIQTKSDGIAFQNISGLMVHIALSTRALSETRREVNDAGAKYYEAIKSIIKRDTPLADRFQMVVNLALSNENPK